MKTVPLHGKKAAGRVAMVDDADYDLVMQHRWNVKETIMLDRHRPSGPYAITNIKQDGHRRSLFMHQLITGYACTDHRNNNGLDNQRHNLRPATSAQNGQNGPPCIGSASLYKGVSWYRRYGKWQAHITIGGKRRSVGYFTNETEAARAYDAAAREAYGEYAYLNFRTGTGG
jgi:hypothetical protein